MPAESGDTSPLIDFLNIIMKDGISPDKIESEQGRMVTNRCVTITFKAGRNITILPLLALITGMMLSEYQARPANAFQVIEKVCCFSRNRRIRKSFDSGYELKFELF